jgi:hypothetical protein
MKFFPRQSFKVLCACFAFFVVAGDIVADSLHEASGACAADCQPSGHDPCPDCGCSIHGGSAVAPDTAAAFGPSVVTAVSIIIKDDQPAIGVAPAIEHPPQLG